MAVQYLIDTNIVSELAKPKPNAGVVAFIAAQGTLLVSSMLFHELVFGVEIAALEQRVRLTAFLSAMRDRFGAAAVPVDAPVAETAGRLRAFARGRGRTMTVADSLIAASAMTRGATLVTRNTGDFDSAGVPLLNPFD